MLRSSSALVLACLLLTAACSGQPAASPSTGTPGTSAAPTGTSAAPTGTPGQSPTTPASQSPAVTPGASLDPALSDAGVVAQATLPNDTRRDRTGTHVIIGQASAASDCATSMDGTEFTAVAWVDDAEEGELRRLSVTVPAGDVPAGDGITADIDGRVSFEFEGSFIGSQYTGDASDDDGSATIDIARAADLLVFNFEGITSDEVEFNGQAICAGV